MKELWLQRRRWYVPFFVVAWLFSFVWPLFARPLYGRIDNDNAWGTEPRLPWWLNWCMTQDNSLLGDTAWKDIAPGHWEWRKKLSWFPVLQKYIGMVGWLYRNAAYGLAWGTFSHTPQPGVRYHKEYTDNNGSYLITGSDGSYEKMTYGKYLNVRTGWLLSNAKVGKPALYLLSIRRAG